jgi:uncharacterized protein (TIGR00297 family)
MHLSQQDLFTTLIALLIIISGLIAIELSIKYTLLNKLLGRKLLHVTAICTCAYIIAHFDNSNLLAFMFLACFFILIWVIRKGWMQVTSYKTYGIALFPLAFALLLFIPVFSKFIVVYAVLILGICDALAGITGEYFGRQKIAFLFENKSWAGFWAFYISSFTITFFYFHDFSPGGILLSCLLALLPAITELFSYRGSDNFTVPLFTAVWVLLIAGMHSNQLLSFLLFTLLFVALAILAVKMHWLTISGATAATWIALMLYSCGGPKAFMAPGIFLITGSLLSRLNKHPKEKDGRNAKQVFANGITGIIFMIFYGISGKTAFLITAVISFCISMSDSVSSETGVYFGKATYDILSLKKIEAGLSGGISFVGTFAGFAGAALLAIITGYFYQFSFPLICTIAGAGFLGMLTDSVLGSWLQVKFNTKDGLLSDDQIPGSQKAKGISWCSNDAVNIISNCIISLLFYFFLRQIR